jgi:hypothetical protein
MKIMARPFVIDSSMDHIKRVEQIKFSFKISILIKKFNELTNRKPVLITHLEGT